MSKLWMYHANCPKGEIVNLSQAEKLEQDGWVKSPALLDLPKEDNTAKMDADQIKRARPEDLVGLVKTMGFKVLSEVEFEAEMNKAKFSAVPVTIESFSDEELIAEAERRGLKNSGSDDLMRELLSQFEEDPESLTKAEHVALGNSLYSLGLRENMKEETLIEKIKTAMNGAE
ncbi:hypothetical protein NVP1184A_10 [Vibrio phage 1.184.A._10N.286.49.A5]|nr:hypothetical protein NVP1184A_10 [Vibrio phage 1.184.A._10N.286.49.A5]